jgi:hypothetical protein
MILMPPEKLTVDQLRSRCAFHEGNAEVYERHNEPGMADQFRQLARKYQEELDKR